MTKNTKVKFETREQWLLEAVKLMSPLFAKHGYKIPALRVACGWPSSRGLSAKKRVLGECWANTAATDKVSQIFISPYLVHAEDPCGVLPTLVHEVVHAIVGHKAGHGAVFGKCARAVGLEGKLTATRGDKHLLLACAEWVKSLGPYPHAKLDNLKSPRKKQTTRLVKCECECGYNCRVTRKWLDEVGAPICPHNKKVMSYTIPDELEGEDND